MLFRYNRCGVINSVTERYIVICAMCTLAHHVDQANMSYLHPILNCNSNSNPKVEIEFLLVGPRPLPVII
jgi:hypothetical protein